MRSIIIQTKNVTIVIIVESRKLCYLKKVISTIDIRIWSLEWELDGNDMSLGRGMNELRSREGY